MLTTYKTPNDVINALTLNEKPLNELPEHSLTKYISEISKYPRTLHCSSKSFISILAFFRASKLILPFWITTVGTPIKNLLKTMLFIDKIETK